MDSGSGARGVALDHATTFWSAVIMLSSMCTLFVTSRWSSHMQTWVPGISGDDVITIITCLDIGAFLAVLPGSCYDSYGCKVVGLTGIALSWVGYASMYAVVRAGAAVGLPLLCFIGFIIGQGSIWLVTCALATVTRNFDKEDRGRAVGLLMTTFGLSAGIFSQLMVTLDGDSGGPSLLVLLGGGIALVSCLAMVGTCSLPPGYALKAEAARTNHVLGMCLLLLVLVTLPTFGRPQVYGVDLWAAMVTVLYGAILLFQLALSARLVLRRGLQVIRSPVLGEGAGDADPLSPAAVEGASFKTALQAPEYWLLLLVFLVAVGVGQTMSNSIADIASIDATAGVAVFAAGNAVGRFVPGYLSDILLKVCDRISFIVVFTVVMILSQLVMVVGQEEPYWAYTGVFLTALSLGSYWVLVPAAQAEWFGRLNFGKINGFLVFVGGDGGVLLIYKGVASWARDAQGPTGCSLACFAFKWQVNVAFSCVALLAALAIKLIRRRCEARTAASQPTGGRPLLGDAAR